MEEHIKRQFKENSDTFRDALERIVQKYSRLDGSGTEVCLRSMTCHSARGVEPWDRVTGSNLLEDVASLESSQRDEGPEDSRDVQDDLQICDDESVSMETSVEKSTGTGSLQWESGVDSSCLLSSMMNDSHCSHTGMLSQPEDQDKELEQTLSSQGNTLLDIYPSMLSQLGDSWHRQRVVEAGSAIRRRYRRHIWFPSAQKSLLNSSIRSQGVKNKRRGGLAYAMDTRSPAISVLNSPEEAPQAAATVCHMDRKSSPLIPGHLPVVTTPSPSRAGQVSPSLPSRRDQWSKPPWRPSVQQGSSTSSPHLKRVAVPQSPAECFKHLHQGLAFQHLRASEDHRQDSLVVLKPCARPQCGLGFWSPARQAGMDSFRAAQLPLTRRSSFSGFQVSHQAASRQIDLEFQKIYHRFVCQARTSLLPQTSAHTCCSPVCSLKKREAMLNSSSSSSLAALALSPARMKKRQREVACNLSPLSKRFRGWGVTHNMSPSRHVDVSSHISLTSTLGRSPGALTCSSPQCIRSHLLSPTLRGECGVLSQGTGYAAKRRHASNISNCLQEGSSRRRLQYNGTSSDWV